MREMLRQRCSVQEAGLVLEQATDDSGGIGIVRGQWFSYGRMNRNGWTHAPGAAKQWVDEFQGGRLPMLQEHETPIGKWVEAKESGRGKFPTGVQGVGSISDVAAGRDTATLLSDQAVDGISIGFDPDWDQVLLVSPDEEIEVETPYGDWKYKAEDWGLVFPTIEILESSIVAVPADPSGRVRDLSQSMLQRAGKAMPGLEDGAEWEDVAYSMALLLGGRGAGQAFEDVDEIGRAQLYARLARQYAEFEKEPPAYMARPRFDQVSFRHDEREIFHDRYLRKGLAGVTAGAEGHQGPLSPGTREQVLSAIDTLQQLADRKDPNARLRDLRDSAKRVLDTVKEGVSGA